MDESTKEISLTTTPMAMAWNTTQMELCATKAYGTMMSRFEKEGHAADRLMNSSNVTHLLNL
jgi:hypothetical protein